MGPLMNWFTANIGYHHVHHLNARIPFYHLPDAMRAIPALQAPECSSLAIADIRACLRLKLWDPDSRQLVPWSFLRNARNGVVQNRMLNPNTAASISWFSDTRESGTAPIGER